MNKYIGETAKAAHKKANELECGGTYKLDGPQAVTYSRLRKLEGGDYKRTERQRTVIKKLFEKITTTDISTINEIIDTVFPQVWGTVPVFRLRKRTASIIRRPGTWLWLRDWQRM